MSERIRVAAKVSNGDCGVVGKVSCITAVGWHHRLGMIAA